MGHGRGGGGGGGGGGWHATPVSWCRQRAVPDLAGLIASPNNLYFAAARVSRVRRDEHKCRMRLQITCIEIMHGTECSLTADTEWQADCNTGLGIYKKVSRRWANKDAVLVRPEAKWVWKGSLKRASLRVFRVAVAKKGGWGSSAP